MGKSRERLEKRAPQAQKEHWAFKKKNFQEREERVTQRGTKDSLENPQLSHGLGCLGTLAGCNVHKGEHGLFCPV